jgi:hypothetical protein
MSERYKIIRMYFRGWKRTIKKGLTLEEAQAHCCDPQTSSTTATKAVARKRTRDQGPWFDCYQRE